MVLFKRKPVQYLEKPVVEDENVEVWEIEETGEIFLDYEQYLSRMDFYKQRKFICQITGHSGLDFLSALRSERTGAREVEEAFPEALKGPILRRVQFQTISRIDNLVDLIYDEFKSDYYPGEAVTVHVVTGDKLTGIVRDKTRFGAKVLPDGTLNPPFSRYFVSLDNRPTEEAVVDDAHIVRDRKIFTKQVLRSFIKKTVSRDAWTGAPWLVKEEVAQQYHIDTRIPPHLRYENKAAERKQNQAQGRKPASDYDGMVGSFSGVGPQQKLPELKPAPKSHKSKQQQQHPSKGKQPMFLNPPQLPGGQPGQYMPGPPPQHYHGHPPQNSFPPQNYPHNGGPQYHPYPPQHQQQHPGHYGGYAPLVSMPQLPPPPPPIKYPIDDLALPPSQEIKQRPPLKFFSQDTPVPIMDHAAKGNGILMESVGPLLESWDTLNVYCEVFKLDSFTFDDFVEAMQFTSEDVECQLFVEVHCATLKQLVTSESEGGKVQIQLPDMEEDSDEDESNHDISAVPTPTPEPEPKPKGRTTRSSLAKSDIDADPKAKSPTVEPKHAHRAAEMQAERDWIHRLKKRDFKDGGWEIIMVGLLYQLSKKASYEKSCEPILKKLAPLDMEPTPETAKQQYASMDVNLRVKALQIVCMLTAETRAVRAYMEECSEQMTAFRKEKIQWQRDRKAAMEEVRALNEERKILLPANMAPSPEPQPKPIEEDTQMGGVDDEVDENEEEIADSDDETPKIKGHSLRRGRDRAAERKRKREAEQEKREKAEAAAKVPKQSKQFLKILKDIQKKNDFIKQCEEEIAILDNDLREADCPRTRVLGKDRFWNRYYWFERNGMPYAGLPSSSTAEAGYANGCLWVQGPDDIEREGFIELTPEWNQEYRHRFNMTVKERKAREEGPTSVFNAHQWGYLDTPAALEDLLSWLDNRGNNENKLRKEMMLYKEKITRNMVKRQEYLHPSEDKKEEAEGSKRMSTRTKHHVETNTTLPYRCLKWQNTTALNELGHLHSEEPPKTTNPRKSAASKKKDELKKEKEREKEVVVEERETRGTRNAGATATAGVPKGRHGKPLGRQGTRYEF